jgi:hypothetical protein
MVIARRGAQDRRKLARVEFHAEHIGHALVHEPLGNDYRLVRVGWQLAR